MEENLFKSNDCINLSVSNISVGGKDMQCDAKKFAQMYEEIYKDLNRFALCRMKMCRMQRMQ